MAFKINPAVSATRGSQLMIFELNRDPLTFHLFAWENGINEIIMHRPKILLLDCSKKLEGVLIQNGFNVSAGTVGFVTGKRKLPHKLYESEVIIYNPKSHGVNSDRRLYHEATIDNTTEQFSLDDASSFLTQGGIILTFVNHEPADSSKGEVYNWIPKMPYVRDTHDEHIVMSTSTAPYALLRPILQIQNIKRPVLHRIEFTSGIPLFENRNNQQIGSFHTVWGKDRGTLIVMPECNDNEEIILDFLLRVLPIFIESPAEDVVTSFRSPDEENVYTELERVDTETKRLKKRFEVANVALANATRVKDKIISEDETAKALIAYYNTALQNPDHALFYLAKVCEALEVKYGAESIAKKVLNKASEWKRINMQANASYADTRHVPKPGDIIQRPTDAIINQCFEDTVAIMHSYFKTLFD